MTRTLAATFLFTLVCAAWSAPAEEVVGERLVHLLSRISYGVQPAESLGPEVYLESQLRQDPGPEPELEAYLARLRTPGRSGEHLARSGLSAEQIFEEMLRQRLLRAILSRWQLREMMTAFWFNHFNADPRKSDVIAWNLPALEESLRARALGRFRDLLEAAAHSPAVLTNLDQSVSSATEPGGVNENFGRELMELYTVGQDSGYTQRDVVEVARCFSGWTCDADSGIWGFDPELHDLGQKLVLGHRIEAGGVEEGERVLDLLARHPATARFIARKLSIRFVCDDPPPGLVDRAAGVFQRTDGDIAQVLACILSSEEFYEPRYRRAKWKDPVEFAASVVLALGADAELLEELAGGRGNGGALLEDVISMGAPYLCPDARGWPDRTSTWVSTAGLQTRLSLAERLGRRAGSGGAVSAPEFQYR
ncbi:MAG: DUF1800 domain-containing protein [Armatimonadetes bacterium]|nr:DUF1800 domain-containing protein [Armatimonadota bacterium]